MIGRSCVYKRGLFILELRESVEKASPGTQQCKHVVAKRTGFGREIQFQQTPHTSHSGNVNLNLIYCIGLFGFKLCTYFGLIVVKSYKHKKFPLSLCLFLTQLSDIVCIWHLRIGIRVQILVYCVTFDKLIIFSESCFFHLLNGVARVLIYNAVKIH